MTDLRELLQYHRPQSMYDSEVHNFITEIMKSGENFGDDPDHLWVEFKTKFHAWVTGSNLNTLHGLDQFGDRDIIVGVTQFIDDLYQTTPNICVLEHEYRYHWRLLGDSVRVKKIEELSEGDNLIVSLPFPYYGDIHPDMGTLIEHCNANDVNVHIDGCWYGCSRDIMFNLDHPCIKSVGFSLSKALGLGANRIGVRYCRARNRGPVSILNEFDMNNQILVWMGIKFMDKFGSDHWQNKYGETYKQICSEYNLTPTNAIHLAWDGDKPCGVRPLLRKTLDGK